MGQDPKTTPDWMEDPGNDSQEKNGKIEKLDSFAEGKIEKLDSFAEGKTEKLDSFAGGKTEEPDSFAEGKTEKLDSFADGEQDNMSRAAAAEDFSAWEQKKREQPPAEDPLKEPERFIDDEATDAGGICDLVLRGIGVAMGVAVTVLSTLNTIQSGTAFIMLGVGLTAVAISVMKKT